MLNFLAIRSLVAHGPIDSDLNQDRVLSREYIEFAGIDSVQGKQNLKM